MDAEVKEKLQSIVNKLVLIISHKVNLDKNKYFILGISGAPATGKSTVSEMLVNKLTGQGIHTKFCPMDGFHFDNKKLSQLGLSEVKGAIETFDVDKFLKFIKQLKSDNKPFYWPFYSRDIHEPVEKGTIVECNDKVFIVEGNYIFFDKGKWSNVKDLIDFKVFLTADEKNIKKRLIERHTSGGKSMSVTLNKIQNVDLPNAKKIIMYKKYADTVLDTSI